MSTNVTLKDMLIRLSQLETSLKESGVPVELIPKVMEHVEEYNELHASLDQAREGQFQNDAYDILQDMRVATNKNVTILTRWLRTFAEHVVRGAFEGIEKTGEFVYDESIEDIVDRVSPINTEE